MASRTSMEKATSEIMADVRKTLKAITGAITVAYLSKKKFPQASLSTFINRKLNTLEETIYPKIDESIKWHYVTSGLDATTEFRKADLDVSGELSVFDQRAIKELQDDAKRKYSEAFRGVFDSSKEVMTEARKQRLDKIFIDGRLQRKTQKQLKSEIQALLNEDFYAIRDKGGRVWQLDDYAEMLSRTRMREATNEGMQNRLKSEGFDLVQVSTNPTSCPLCQPYQGVILSMSGQTTGYDTVANAESGGLFHPNCYDKDTQVYTDSGWKYFKDLDGEKIFSLNPDTLIPEWLPYVDFISYKFNDKMYHYKSNSFDLMVTPNHNMFIGYYGRENGKRVTKYRLCEAQDTPKNFKQLRSVNWQGKELDYSDEFIRLVGYFVAEGYVDSNGYSRKVVISQTKEQKMIDDLLGIGFYQNGEKLLKTDRKLFNYFKKFGKASEKKFPEEFMGASKRQIRILLDAFRLGDGSTTYDKEYNSTERQYFTSSEKLAEQLGELIIKVGNYPSFRFENRKGKVVKHRNGDYETKTDMWVIRENTSKHSYFNSSPSTKHRGIQLKKIDYNDYVYDVELPKHHVLLVRRNGKIAWSGNCRHRLLPYHPEIAQA